MDTAAVLADLAQKVAAIEAKTVEPQAAKAQAEEVARAVDGLPPNDSLSKAQKAELLFLKGKALSLLDMYDRRAEDALGKSVKLNPSQLEAWNILGEVFYQKKDYPQSKRCFESALQLCGINKISLRKLSMVSRFLGNPEERAANVRESVKLAKEAVKLDLNDGESWYVLGNAHLTNFFVNESSTGELNAALRSYTQAESHLSGPNPDLHFNRATAFKFLESYNDALKDFRRAHELDPGLNANTEIEWIENFLAQVAAKLSSQCGFKPKKLQGLVKQLPTALNAHPFAQNYTFKRVLELADFANSGAILACKILSRLSRDTSETPARFIAVDSTGSLFVLSFYNASPSAHSELTPAATVFIRDPFRIAVRASVSEQVVAMQPLQYFCVRVGDPNMVLVDNKSMEGIPTQSVLVNKPI